MKQAILQLLLEQTFSQKQSWSNFEEILNRYFQGIIKIPNWVIFFLCFAWIPALIYLIVKCCGKCCKEKDLTLVEADKKIQEYLKQQKSWLESKELFAIFQDNGDALVVTLARTKKSFSDIAPHLIRMGIKDLQQCEQLFNQKMALFGQRNPEKMMDGNNMNIYGQKEMIINYNNGAQNHISVGNQYGNQINNI